MTTEPPTCVHCGKPEDADRHDRENAERWNRPWHAFERVRARRAEIVIHELGPVCPRCGGPTLAQSQAAVSADGSPPFTYCKACDISWAPDALTSIPIEPAPSPAEPEPVQGEHTLGCFMRRTKHADECTCDHDATEADKRWRAHWEEAIRERDETREAARAAGAVEAWRWQSDGGNFLESMSNGMVVQMTAGTLRELLAKAAPRGVDPIVMMELRGMAAKLERTADQLASRVRESDTDEQAEVRAYVERLKERDDG